MSEQQPPPLTLEQAAQYLNISQRYMRRLVAERRVAFHKVGRLLRFRTTDLDEFLDRCRIEPSPPRGFSRRIGGANVRLAEAARRSSINPALFDAGRSDA